MVSSRNETQPDSKERLAPKPSWIGKELGKRYLRTHGVKEARAALRYYLSRALQDDGNLQMTKARGSMLTVYFTEILTHKDVFDREKKFLTFREHELCIMRFADGLRMKEIEHKTRLARRTIDDALRRAIDRMMPLVFGD